MIGLSLGLDIYRRGAAGGGGVTPVVPDYTFTSNAELQAILGLGAEIEGKLIHAVGEVVEPLTIASRTWSIPPIFGCAPGATVQRMTLQDVSGALFSGMRWQMRGWPKNYGECLLLLGSIVNVDFRGCRWRHGHGASQADYDLAANYPEYERVSNVTTATTTSSRIELAYADSAAVVPRDAFIEFFNRGSNPVRFAIGDGSVTATLSSTLAPANARTRVTWNTGTTDRPTHIAVITPSGTSEVNARTEIGLGVYMADAVTSAFPTAQLNNVRWIECVFEDVTNPLKAPGTPVGVVAVDRCVFRRTYMDSVAFAGHTDTPGVEIWVTRNISMQPGSRSGIAENLQGDARDPHGDFFQIYQPNAAAQSQARFYIAGNRYQPAAVRAGVTNQGIFMSPPQVSPTHIDLTYVLANILPFDAQNQIAIGRAVDSLSRNSIIQNNTVIGVNDLTGSAIQVFQNVSGPYHALVRDNIARQITSTTDVVREGNAIWSSGDLGAVFATPSARLDSSLSVDGFTEAVAPVGALSGKGFRADMIDWTIDDPTQAINWPLVDAGVRFRPEQNVATSSTIASDWRRAIGGPATMSIDALSGSEYRIADAPDGSGASSWTSSAGTIARGKWLQIRGPSSADPLTFTYPGVVINGQSITFGVQTAGPFFTSAGDFGFQDPTGSSSLSGAAGRLTMEMTLLQTTLGNRVIYQHSGQLATLDILSTGQIRITIRDSSNTTVLALSTSASGVLVANTPQTILASIDLPGQRFRAWVNGDIVLDLPIAANTGNLSATGVMNLLQTSAGATRFVGRCYGLRIWKGVSVDDGLAPTAAPYFELPGVAATANASPWKVGAGVAT